MPERVLERAPSELASRALTARVAALALRLANLLEEHCTALSGAPATASFLRAWASDSDVADPTADIPLQPLDLLTARYELSADDVDLLLLAGLPEEHEGLAGTMRQLHPFGEPRVSAGLAALLLGAVGSDRSAVRRLLATGQAVRHRLVQFAGQGTLFETSLVCAPQLWDALHGHDSWPAELDRVRIGPVPPGLDRWLTDAQARAAAVALRDEADRVVLLVCPDETVALGRCAALASAAHVGLVASRLDPDDRLALPLLAAHAAARGSVPVVLAGNASREPNAGSAPLLEIADVPGPIVLCAATNNLRIPPDRAVLPLSLDGVTTADRRAAWSEALPHLAGRAAELAARHPIDPAHTATIAIDATSQAMLSSDCVGVSDVTRLIRARAALTLPAGTELVTSDVPWHRLVVDEEAGAQLRDAVARLTHQSTVLDDWGMRTQARASRGVRLLFTGPPGTGKSLAAETVATAAATDLLAVDVSHVVSKWIGETEKNLGCVFDAAERTQAVLFLDEADALFGARTELTDAHDRYANLETAYLLQRLDHFDGLVVLATNLGHNVDPAFLRRMDFVIDFPMPDLPARRTMWTLHLPVAGSAVLADDIDTETLARAYPVPGGWIRNAAVAAAFLAAGEGEPIRQRHLLAAIRREYAKAALPYPGEAARRTR